MANSGTGKMDLYALIRDSIQTLYPNAEGPNITLATHDKLWWVIIFDYAGTERRMFSGEGFETAEAAMEDMLSYLGDEIWKKLNEEGIALAK